MPTNHNISRAAANAEIQRFLDIRTELRSPQVLALLSPQAATYVSSQLLSFAFESAQVQAKLQAVDGNAYRIYPAAKTDGVPTIVIVPAEIGENDSVSNKMGLVGSEADQWPNTSRSASGVIFDIGIE